MRQNLPASDNQQSAAQSEIEAIDRDLHALLMRRTVLSEALAAMEREGGTAAAIRRPALTARVFRCVLARHEGSFPLHALISIWSDIQFAAGPQGMLHVYAGEDAQAYWELARMHFGSMISLVAHSSAAAVVHACADDHGALGVVPPPESVENGKTWWDQLAPASHAGPRFVQSLPFVSNEGVSAMPQAYAIGTIEQEPTGADTTILGLECHAELSRARLQTLLRQAGFEAQIIASSRESVRSPSSRILVANRGFVATDDPRTATLVAKGSDAIARVSQLGGFADPFRRATEGDAP